MNYRHARFLTSAPTLQDCPPDQGGEVAFIGRSNAGKSSALNCLTGHKKLARTSKSPGRTQLMNFFSISSHCRLVDLPGYGFAKAPMQVKQTWQRHLEDYLSQRHSLKGLVLLMDIRHPLQACDQTILSWAYNCQMPIHILLTKADKVSHGRAKSISLDVQKKIERCTDIVSVQLFSSLKPYGIDALTAKLNEWLCGN